MSDQPESLEPTLRDHLTVAAKSALGAVPFAGTLLAELAGELIPNQRIDRLVRFAEALDSRFKQLSQQFVRTQLTDENFCDLVEESMRQAARAITEERREYIATLVANGLRPESVDYIESKHLLRILGELNDIELVWLRFYLHPATDTDREFRQKHADVLEAVGATFDSTPTQRDKAALQQSYHEHLAQMNLLAPRYQVINKQVQFDSRTGAPKLLAYELTPLGRLLLREIGLAPPPRTAG